jgi:hypothetical protein
VDDAKIELISHELAVVQAIDARRSPNLAEQLVDLIMSREKDLRSNPALGAHQTI